eukprot:5038949-Pleurochrysis_carterae.AAC.1
MAAPFDAKTCVCGACKQVMLDMDGKPRNPAGVAHDCSECNVKIHAPMVCDAVWFPVVSSNAREFCSKECLLAYNRRKTAEEALWAVVPVKYRSNADEPPEEVQQRIAAASKLNELGRNGVDNYSEHTDSNKPGNVDGPGTGTTKANTETATNSNAGENENSELGRDNPPTLPESSEEERSKHADVDSSSAGLASAPAAAESAAGVDDSHEPGAALDAPQAPTVAASSFGGLALGDRVKFNFTAAPGVDEWHGGVVGNKTDRGAHVGFDDGDLRFFEQEELNCLNEVWLFLRMGVQEVGGLVDNVVVTDQAVGVTTLKEGRMEVAKVVGVLVGTHDHGIAGLPVHVAHHVDAEAGGEGARLRSRVGKSAVEAARVARKGYHTYRCGDRVQCTSEAAKGAKAVVFGVMVASISCQMRRVLVLYEEPKAGAKIEGKSFFMAPWAMWARTLADESAVDLSDVDDDSKVLSVTANEVHEVRKAWLELSPLKNTNTESGIVYALTSKGRGLPPSMREPPKPPRAAGRGKPAAGRGNSRSASRPARGKPATP